MVFWAVLWVLFYGTLLLRVWQLACTILQARLHGCAVSMTGVLWIWESAVARRAEAICSPCTLGPAWTSPPHPILGSEPETKV